nr:hypothetical protein [Angustibacter aerolatus]
MSRPAQVERGAPLVVGGDRAEHPDQRRHDPPARARCRSPRVLIGCSSGRGRLVA